MSSASVAWQATDAPGRPSCYHGVVNDPARTPHISPELPVGTPFCSDFFARPSDQVGRDLVGKILWMQGVGGGRLTEVEAYLPEDDPACHAFRGLTARNAAMFGPPGTIYVYVSYGIHVLLNLVCDCEGVGSAVLLRSFEPLGDTRVLAQNRAGARRSADTRPVGGAPRPLAELSCGPGRVGQALGLHLGLNGLPLGDKSGLFIIDDRWRPEVACSTRIGISKGDRLPLRYYASGSAYVSGSRRTSRGEGT